MKIFIKNITQSNVSIDAVSLGPLETKVLNIPLERRDALIAQLELASDKVIYSTDGKSVQVVQRQQFYVSSSGNDTFGTGSQTAPYASIQRALDNLQAIEGPVVINVGPGTFTGFRIDGLNTGSVLKAGPSLIIRGTLETILQPFVSTSAVNGTFGSLSSISVSGANWAVDSLKGCFLQNVTTASQSFAVIISNTATSISFFNVTGFSTVGDTFQVVRPATIIQGNCSQYNQISVTSSTLPESGTEAPTLIRIANSGEWGQNFGIVLQWLNLLPASTDSAIKLIDSAVYLRQSQVAGSSTGTGISMFRSRFHAIACYFGGSIGSKINASVAVGNGPVNCDFCVFDSGLFGVFGGKLFISGSYFKNMSLYGIRPQGVTFIGSCGFDTCTAGISVDDAANYSSGGEHVSIGLNAGMFINCPTGIYLANGKATLLGKAFSITNATVGILAQWGARVGIRSDASISSTPTEVQLDSITTTYTAMRAASPRLIKDPTFGSSFYESTFT